MANVTRQVRFYTDQVLEEYRRHSIENVREAATFLSERIKSNLNHQGSKKNRSKPGQFPFKQTGTLQKSIQARVDTKDKNRPRAYVTVGVEYGLILELSPRLKRSFIIRTFEEKKRDVAKILMRRKRR